ncbi:hypothetical protein [Senimuribacter intestinalis]|uniref:hypothetical protein n=1 Tax=Senimuribacter intestinalis TaxID=2941507 RepID=UPI00203C8D78|nr:hypothetical protein [Senimuribacter intestinalis]
MKGKEKAPEGAIIKNQPDDTTKMMVLSMLTNKPQDRFTLAAAIGINERTFREAVRQLRREGYQIISESRGHGYRLGTKKEAKVMARELRSRAYDMLRTANAMESQLDGQVTMEEVM